MHSVIYTIRCFFVLSRVYAQCGTRTHDLKIKPHSPPTRPARHPSSLLFYALFFTFPYKLSHSFSFIDTCLFCFFLRKKEAWRDFCDDGTPLCRTVVVDEGLCICQPGRRKKDGRRAVKWICLYYKWITWPHQKGVGKKGANLSNFGKTILDTVRLKTKKNYTQTLCSS